MRPRRYRSTSKTQVVDRFLSFPVIHKVGNVVLFIGTENVNVLVAGSIPTGRKLFAHINLPFTTKQYKNDNIANFV